jgi:hypothetical protein
MSIQKNLAPLPSPKEMEEAKARPVNPFNPFFQNPTKGRVLNAEQTKAPPQVGF